MKLAIVSDTHDNVDVIAAFVRTCNEREVDAVLHCGDFCSPFVARQFSKLNKGVAFHAIRGNNDGDIVHLNRTFASLGEIKENCIVLDLAGCKVLAMHGHAITEAMIDAIARAGAHDIVVYGHYHHVRDETVGTTRVLNPGEACGYLTGKATCMLATLEPGRVDIEVVTLATRDPIV